MKELYRKAQAIWGKQVQEDIAIEELSELTKAIVKLRRYGRLTDWSNLIEEIADVEIMIEQLKIMHNIPEENVEAHRKVKLSKLEKLILKHEAEKVS